MRVVRPVAAVRFQAKRSNELWHFDMNLSDLKQVEAPLWIERAIIERTRHIRPRQRHLGPGH